MEKTEAGLRGLCVREIDVESQKLQMTSSIVSTLWSIQNDLHFGASAVFRDTVALLPDGSCMSRVNYISTVALSIDY